MKLQMSRRQELSELAETVVGLHSPQPGAVNLDSILRENGIRLHPNRFPEDFDAIIVPTGNTFHIHLNIRKVDGNPDSRRARFSIAHELGHYFIDEHRTRLLTEPPQPSLCGLFDGNECKEEDEADHFAANLIMPPSHFKSAAHGQGSPLETILKLSRKFDASLTATAIQFTNHVSDRSMVIRWTPEGTLAWALPGRGYRTDGYRTVIFKTPEKLPKDSATANVIAGKHDHDKGVLTMASIFQNVALAGERNTLVTEEAIALGDYGVLTIISDHGHAPTTLSPRTQRRQSRKFN